MNKHNDLVRRYDVLALEPTSERAFTSACNNKRVDLITLPLGIRMPFRLRAATIKSAANNGIALEVSYNAALMDTAARRNFFSNATSVVRAVGSGAGGGVGGRAGTFHSVICGYQNNNTVQSMTAGMVSM